MFESRAKQRKHNVSKVWLKAKAVLRGKYTVTSACIKKGERPQINNLTSILRN